MPLISFDKILRILEILVSVLKMAVQAISPQQDEEKESA